MKGGVAPSDYHQNTLADPCGLTVPVCVVKARLAQTLGVCCLTLIMAAAAHRSRVLGWVLAVIEDRGVLDDATFLRLFATSRQVWRSTQAQEAARFEQFERTIGEEKTCEMWDYVWDEPSSDDEPSSSASRAITIDRVRRGFWSMFWKHARKHGHASTGPRSR